MVLCMLLGVLSGASVQRLTWRVDQAGHRRPARARRGRSVVLHQPFSVVVHLRPTPVVHVPTLPRPLPADLDRRSGVGQEHLQAAGRSSGHPLDSVGDFGVDAGVQALECRLQQSPLEAVRAA